MLDQIKDSAGKSVYVCVTYSKSGLPAQSAAVIFRALEL